MQGKIMKGISGFYYVHVIGSGIYECRAKGIFRNQKIKPLVGDDVEIDLLDEKGKEGNVPLYKDNKLAKTLSKLEIGDAIPPELYDVVAEILVFVDDMDRLRSKIS